MSIRVSSLKLDVDYVSLTTASKTESASTFAIILIKVEGQKIIAGADRKYKGLYNTYDEKILRLHLIHIIVVCSITTLS